MAETQGTEELETQIAAGVLRALEDIVGADAVHLDESIRRRCSEDYSWISPILAETLPATVADVVVRPNTPRKVARVLAVAARHRVPVTPRGMGTGNYGQSVPLAGGIVLDLSRLNRITDVRPGWIEAQAGTSFAALESAANSIGQELALFPSMLRSTLGGFLSGGNQGIGSVANGSIWDGYVSAVTVASCHEFARLDRHEGPDCLPHLHGYGTTGVLTDARIRLVPAEEWTALFASFDAFSQAAGAAVELFDVAPAPRNISIDDAALVRTYPPHPGIVDGKVSLRALTAVDAVETAQAIIERHGGEVVAVDIDAVDLLVTTSFNHSTMRALRSHSDLCSVQVRGDALVERHAEVMAVFDGSLLHLDGNRKAGVAGFSGHLLSPFTDAERLYLGVERLQELGVTVIDPHVWVLGGHGETSEFTRSVYDPHGLLNPGRLAAA